MAYGSPTPSKKLPGQRTQPTAAQPSTKAGPQNTGPSVPEFSDTNWKPPPAPNLPPVVGAPTGPVFPQDAAQPIAFNGGYFNPTEAPHGFDQSQPGQVEQFWGNNQNLWFQSPQLDWVDSQQSKFEDPWAGEQKVASMIDSVGAPGAGQQYWKGVQGEFNAMGQGLGNGYQGPNNAQTAFDMTKGMLPGSMQPQFDAYYDRMKAKSMSDVNSQSAARGAYGSSAGLNGSIGAGLDIEAQRAKANTDFMLADSQNQANWQGLLGNQGRAADLSGLGIYGSKIQGAQLGLDKMRLGGQLAFDSERMDLDKQRTQADLAFGMDDQALERMGAGISTAFNSQQAHRGQLNDAFDASNIADNERDERVNTLYGQNSDFSNDLVDYFSSNYDQLFKGDSAAFEQQLEAMIAQAADQRGWDEQTRERIFRDIKEGVETAAKAKEGGLFK